MKTLKNFQKNEIKIMEQDNELKPKTEDRLLCLKIGKEIRENIYEMTRKYWKVDITKARKATHVLAISDGKVVAVFIPSRWYYTDNPAYGCRIEFEGEEVPGSEYIGKSVTSYYGRGSNPAKYINF